MNCARDGQTPAPSSQIDASTPSRANARSEAAIEQDLRTMIGGNFTPDGLGPDVHAAILGRARANPNEYLSLLVDRVVGNAPDAEWLSNVRCIAVVEPLRDAAPQASANAAKKLVVVHEAALKTSEQAAADASRISRLKKRIAGLKLLQ